MKKVNLLVLLLSQWFLVQSIKAQNIEKTDDPGLLWKVGVAKAVITPSENMWMSGYAARDKPSEGKLHDLWAKALAMEDENGEKALIITTDIVGFSRDLSFSICNRLKENYQLDRKNIILSTSHTHSGPVINSNLIGIYPSLDEHQKKQIAENKQFVEEQIIDIAGEALENLVPAHLSSGVGIARFAVNRRENIANDEFIYNSEIKGPSDHVVQVVGVHEPSDQLIAVLFGYSCHATCLSMNSWSGDYPGFAQIELENTFPGVNAMFFAGFGGDQNPIPRGSISLAGQYGKELAATVIEVLKNPTKKLHARLITQYDEIELRLDAPPEFQELDTIIKNGAEWQKNWAIQMKEKQSSGKKLAVSYPHYPIQTWQIGDQSMVVLGGEVVVDYAFRLRKIFGNDLMIMGYANDVMAYIPSELVLKEGGYEGETSMWAYGHPAAWAPGIEDKIVNVVVRQVKIVRKGL